MAVTAGGEILGRVSTDNGDTWLDETRLTDTQSGEFSSCMILNDILYVAWNDYWLLGCSDPKILLSHSTDWGISWSEPQSITSNSVCEEGAPFLIYSFEHMDTLLHCFYEISDQVYGPDLYYVRSRPFYSDRYEMPDDIPVVEKLKLKAFPTVFKTSTIITFEDNYEKEAELEIYNVLGQKIWSKKLIGKEGSVIWDAHDKNGDDVASGVYFAKVETSFGLKNIKLIILR
jgi:hypothetical protein